jgi:glycosyltransferase involved in cell wall biosynthesis
MSNKNEGGMRLKGKVRMSFPGKPLVTIITVVLNGASHLEQAITSVLDQSYDNIEYCIIDGGSTDRTVDIIKKYEERIAYWISEPDQGIYDAMNKGIKLAQGDLIGILNADDFYNLGAVGMVVDSYLQNGNPCGIIYGNNYILLEDLGIQYTFGASLNFGRGMPIGHPAIFVHRECYRQIGGFNNQFRLAADFDFLVRAAKGRVPFVAIDGVLVTFRATGLSTANPLPLIRETMMVIVKYFGLLSAEFVRFALRCLRDIPLLGLKKVLLKLLGRNAVLNLRRGYTRLFISRGK